MIYNANLADAIVTFLKTLDLGDGVTIARRRIVSTKLPTVHSPTRPPSHNSEPVRATSTSAIGLRRISATSGGRTWRNEATARCVSSLCPSSDNTAAAVMKLLAERRRRPVT